MRDLAPAGVNVEGNRLDVRRVRLPHRVGAHDDGARLVVANNNGKPFTVPSAHSVGAGFHFWAATASGAALTLTFETVDLVGASPTYTIAAGTLAAQQFCSDGQAWYATAAEPDGLIAGTGITVTGSGTSRTITATGADPRTDADTNVSMAIEAHIDGDGNILASIGVASVSHDEQGDYTIYFNVDLGGDLYPAVACASADDGNNVAEILDRTATSCRVRIYSNHNSGPERNDASFSLMAGGTALPAPASYSTTGAHFGNGSGDTDVYLARNGSLTGAGAASFGVWSVWYKQTDIPAPEDTAYILYAQDVDNRFLVATYLDAGPTYHSFIQVGGFDGQITLRLDAPSFGSWAHDLVSWRTDALSGLKTIQWYRDDVLQSPTITDNDDVFTVDYGAFTQLGIAATVDGPPIVNDAGGYNGDLSDLQFFTPAAFLDLSVEANRRLFIDADGKPADPDLAAAAIGDPLILQAGSAAAYPTNQGTAGGMDLVGVLTDASSSPSD